MRFTMLLLVALALGCSKTEVTPHSDPVTLSDVQSIALVSWGYALDGGTMTLFARTDSDDDCAIALNQRVDGTYPNPGRLFFNGRMIEVRSADESAIIGLLKSASVEPVEPPDAGEDDLSNALIIGDDIKHVLGNTIEENLNEFRDEIITFVESDEYVRMAEHGLSG